MWRPSLVSPRRYACDDGRHPLWDAACSTTVRSGKPTAARALEVSGINISKVLKQLNGKTVVILGDSTSVELWCAMTCVLLQTGAHFINSSHSSALSSLIQGAATAHMQHYKIGADITWMLPSCGALKANCWTGHSQSLTIPCGQAFFDALRHAGFFSLNRPVGTELVVIYNPCTAHYNSPLLDTTMRTWQQVTWSDMLSRGEACLESPIECFGCSWSTNSSLRGPHTCSSRSSLIKEAVVARLKWERKLRTVVDAAARILHELRLAGHLGILLGSMPAHFQEVSVAPSALHFGTLGIAHGYERFILTPLLRLIHHAKQCGLSELDRLHVREPSRAPQCARNLLRALDIHSNTTVVPWTGLKGGKNFAWFVHGALQVEARCAMERDPARCWQREIRASPTPIQQFANWRPRRCVPHKTSRTRNDEFTAVRLETQMAVVYGVPLLARFGSRMARWDGHKADSGGQDPANANFDCLHSNFEPGVWDGELSAFQQLLEEYAVKKYPTPQDPKIWFKHLAHKAHLYLHQQCTAAVSKLRLGGDEKLRTLCDFVKGRGV